MTLENKTMTTTKEKTYSSWEWAADNGYVNCILNDYHGIYVPHKFATGFDGWTGCEESDLEILREGPDHEHYWEAWDDVVASAKFTDDDGKTWSLYVDGDLFAIDDSINICFDA